MTYTNLCKRVCKGLLTYTRWLTLSTIPVVSLSLFRGGNTLSFSLTPLLVRWLVNLKSQNVSLSWYLSYVSPGGFPVSLDISRNTSCISRLTTRPFYLSSRSLLFSFLKVRLLRFRLFRINTLRNVRKTPRFTCHPPSVSRTTLPIRDVGSMNGGEVTRGNRSVRTERSLYREEQRNQRKVRHVLSFVPCISTTVQDW